MDADAASSEQGRAFRGGPGEDVLFAGHGARHLESIKAKVDFVDTACYVLRRIRRIFYRSWTGCSTGAAFAVQRGATVDLIGRLCSKWRQQRVELRST